MSSRGPFELVAPDAPRALPAGSRENSEIRVELVGAVTHERGVGSVVIDLRPTMLPISEDGFGLDTATV
jgi:hypothetical protein